MIEIIKESASVEIRKAYNLGYQTAKKEYDDNSGGREVDEDKKLVYKAD